MPLSKKTTLLLKIFLILILALELGMHSYWKNYFGPYVSPVLALVSGLLFCLVAFVISGFQKEDMTSFPSKIKIPKLLIFCLLFVIFGYWCGNFMNKVFTKIPIDPAISDIIPSLQLYVARFLNYEPVYAVMHFEKYEMYPTYLPLLWSPYLVSETANIDYRWTPYIFFMLAIFLYLRLLLKSNFHPIEIGIKLFIPFLFVYLYTQFDAAVLGMTVELLPVAFYFLLSLSLFRRNIWIISIGILVCLLSRYSFTFWLPVYLITIWIEFGFPKIFKTSIILALGIALLYVAPFLSKDFSTFSKGLAYYENHSAHAWRPAFPSQADSKPFHLEQGLGMALHFFDYKAEERSIPERLKFAKAFHLSICLLTAIFILLGYLYYRKRELNVKIYFLIALKCYLLIFYSFVFIPFSYLFQVPLFLSIPILYNVRFSKAQDKVAIKEQSVDQLGETAESNLLVKA